MRGEQLTFIVTFKAVSGKMALTLAGDEARNCLESTERLDHALGLVRAFINGYFGSEVVESVDVEPDQDNDE